MAKYNPLHPGKFIKEVYLDPFNLTYREVADHLKVSRSTISRLVNQHSDLSPEMALRLSKVLGRSPESWLAMQDSYDLWKAKKTVNVAKLKKLDLGE
jgi:addiction module HigA family antidote